MMDVKVIEITAANVLVEFTDTSGMLQRKYISRGLLPVDRRGPAHVADDLVYMGVDYSDVDLEATLGSGLPAIPVRELMLALRKEGIWTREDYLKKPKEIAGVLQHLYGVDAQILQNAAMRSPAVSEE